MFTSKAKMPAKQLDVAALKIQVEAAMEVLLRAADARVQWKQPEPAHADTTETITSLPSLYAFLPGVYRSVGFQNQDTAASLDSDTGAFTLVLHGDNTFEYTWEMHRLAPRAMEYRVEMAGIWSKPVLNRSRRGDDDQRVFLTTKRIRFQRLSNYDAENQTWKMVLRTLTRHGSDWAPVGESERGVPPINLVFSCADGALESTGVVAVPHILTNSPACRVLAGLTKKVANKLGGPLDVMTEKWLPGKHMRLVNCVQDQALAKSFNPFFCLAEALLQSKPQRIGVEASHHSETSVA